MSAPHGPRGGPGPGPAAPAATAGIAMPEMPDLSHLTEDERKIDHPRRHRPTEEGGSEGTVDVKVSTVSSCV